MGAWHSFTKEFREWWADTKGSLAVVFGALSLALLVIGVCQSLNLLERYPVIEWGSLGDAFAAAGTLLAVIVALWQSVVLRRQAKDEAKGAADRFQAEIDAANHRTIQEVEAAERRSQRELDAATKRHEAELATQREVARTQRIHLREQEFKVAVTRVARAAGAYTHELATLLSETQHIITKPTRQERDDEVRPIARRMNLAAHSLTIEISGAHMLTNNQQLHLALDPIVQAGMEATLAANEYQNTLIWTGQSPNSAPIYVAMEKVNRVIGDASRLAGELLVTGWD
jgi:hypothetical protein